MKNWKQSTVSPSNTIEVSIKKMDAAGFRFLSVIDENQKLLGVLTDGDIRRAILNSVNLSDPVTTIMSKKPIVAHFKTPRAELLSILRRDSLYHIPLINENQQLVDVVSVEEILGLSEQPNWVVLMVGGLGSRLKRYTQNCPKPMLEIAEKPILEIILDSFIAQGFRKFCFSVNYLSDVIKRYFGDGKQFGVEIKYIEENKKLGTAGSLSLISPVPEDDFIVMNGDILTSINFADMLKFHREHRSVATMAVRQYEFQVPYGVVNIEGAKIIRFDEKPRQQFFINAGIYVLSPDCLKYVPSETEFDMPTLFSMLNESHKNIAPYPLHEKWIDIGEVEEFEYAKSAWNVSTEVITS